MASIYDQHLDRNQANYQPLTPLTFLERAASVFPEHIAVIHGNLKITYREFYARCRSLASALAQQGVGAGDTVSVMLANTPAMLEVHYAVPMCGAHTLVLTVEQLPHHQSKRGTSPPILWEVCWNGTKGRLSLPRQSAVSKAENFISNQEL